MSRITKNNIKTIICCLMAIALLSTTIILRRGGKPYRTIKINDDEYRQITTTTNVKETESTVNDTAIETTTMVESIVEDTTKPTTTIEGEDTTKHTIEIKMPTLTTKRNFVVFYYDDNEPVYVTAEEYYTICGIVMNEAGADYGSYEGRIAVAQCIRNQIIREKRCGHPYDIATIRSVYGEHTTKTPSDDVRKSVTDVFYNHMVVTKEPIIAWCASGYRGWHNNNAVYVCTYGGNDFYKVYDNHYLY